MENSKPIMSNTDKCIVSVAFREPYVTHSVKQLQTLYYWAYDKIVFRDQLPYKDGVHTENIVEHFQKSLYGFKPQAIQKAIDKGYRRIVWFDPSVLPVSNVQILFDALETHPIITRPGEEWLPKMCNQKAKNWFGVTDEDIKDKHTVAGTIYGFNFNDPKAVEVFNLWKKAEEEGIFGNQDEFMAGHWADEACMALSLHKTGVESYWVQDFKYLNQKEL